jgi:signal transduction histidine kinase
MVRVGRRTFTSLPVAVGASFGLLLLLGTLQYRWVGQLGEAERTQLRAGAKARAEALARDFDAEVTRAFMGLLIEPETLRERSFGEYAERYERWQRRTTHPGLVKSVLLVEREGTGLRLSRYAPARRTFEPAQWTSDLALVRTRVEQFSEQFSERFVRGDQQFERSIRRGAADLLWEELPALMMPVPSLLSAPRPSGPPPIGLLQVSAFVIVILDLDHIQRELLPALADRHFGSGGVLDYKLAVLKQGDPRAVVWRSEPDAPTGASGDAAAGMLELRFGDARATDVATLARRRLSDPPVERGPVFFAAPPRRLSFGFPGTRAGLRAVPEDAGRWRLVATHRTGSVDHVVAAARRRNLAVSFGILALLGASTALVVASAQRSRRLAERQVEFVAGVSHELRTPVSVICSAAENLADGLVEEPAQVRRYGVMLRDEGRRLAEMVEQVLEFAGTYSGRRTYRSEPIDVARLIDEALDLSSAELRRAEFSVVRDFGPGLPVVRGDAAALRRAVQNLVGNSLKYGAEGRWVGVRVAAVSEAGRPEVRITVEDHGRGIPAAELARVFEPFFRGREAVAAQTRGFGLGLSLVKRVAEAHGGRVSVDSAPGRGAAFAIHLPASSRPDDAPQPAHGLAHPAR